MSVYFFAHFYFRAMPPKSKIDKYVIAKIREKRIEKGISQSQLAFELNVSTGFVAMAENVRYNQKYNVNHLNEIAKILECSPKDFWPVKPI